MGNVVAVCELSTHRRPIQRPRPRLGFGEAFQHPHSEGIKSMRGDRRGE